MKNIKEFQSLNDSEMPDAKVSSGIFTAVQEIFPSGF
jgi:hypothetical protein